MKLAVFRAATQGRPYKDILADLDESPARPPKGAASARRAAQLDVPVDGLDAHQAAAVAEDAARPHVTAGRSLMAVPFRHRLTLELPGAVDAGGAAVALGVRRLQLDRAVEAGGQLDDHLPRARGQTDRLPLAARVRERDMDVAGAGAGAHRAGHRTDLEVAAAG